MVTHTQSRIMVERLNDLEQRFRVEIVYETLQSVASTGLSEPRR